jgi:hypothetical protein
MSFECVDVPKRRIFYTCDRATIVHQVSDIITALPHVRKPLLHDRSQFGRAIGQPDIDSRIAFYSRGQTEDIVRTDQPAQVQRNARRFMSAHNVLVDRRAAAKCQTKVLYPDSSIHSDAQRRRCGVSAPTKRLCIPEIDPL